MPFVVLEIKDKHLIRWKLREIMARERFTIRKLALVTGLHKNTIAGLRNYDTLPGLGEGTMEKLCRALNCSPFDLIEYIPDPPPPNDNNP